MSLSNRQRAREAYDHAEALFCAHRVDQAADNIQQALTLDPAHAEAWLLQARIALKQGDAAQAIKSLDQHDHHHTGSHDSPSAALLRVEALMAQDQHEQALVRGELLHKAFPDDVPIGRMIVGLYLHSDRTDDAIAVLQHLRELAPSDAHYTRLLAKLQSQNPSQEPTQAEIDRLIDDPDQHDPVAKLTAARWCYQTERFAEAEALYRGLLEQYPDEQELWLEAGQLADTCGDEENAMRRLERAIDLPGADTQTAEAALATAHMHAGRFLNAAACWWKILRHAEKRHQPANIDAWAGLLVCAHLLGRDKLVRRAEKQLRRHSSRRERRQRLAIQWQQAATAHAAERELVRAVHIEESPLDDLLTAAAETLARLSEAYPSRADVHYHFGTCAEALGSVNTATEAARRALVINPNYDSARELCHRLLRRAA